MQAVVLLRVAFVLCLTWAIVSTPAQACRLALAIGLDVSGSVDQREYRLQLDGLADALSDPDVRRVLLSGPPVSLAVYEWSSSSYQRIVQDWVLIKDQSALSTLVAKLRGWQRGTAPDSTGLGAALAFGKALLDRAPKCWRNTLDVSGDGKNNDWPTPRHTRAEGALHGIEINGLVIAGNTDPDKLVDYFKALVIQGPDAFVEKAVGFEDYSKAMRRKLLREMITRPVGQLMVRQQ